MYNYNRSTQLLSTTVAELRSYPHLSPDTIAILLMLTASLPKHEFDTIIDYIPEIYPINSKLKTLHNTRQIIGSYARDYLMLHAMQISSEPICSDELQQLISNIKDYQSEELPNHPIVHAKRKQMFFSYNKPEKIW